MATHSKTASGLDRMGKINLYLEALALWRVAHGANEEHYATAGEALT